MRVVNLGYTVELPEHIRFAPSAKITSTLGQFTCVLEGVSLTATPLRDYEDVDSARADLEPYLQGWEAKAHLIDQAPITFKFSSSHTTEVNDAGGDSHAVNLTDEARLTDENMVVERSDYPTPDVAWKEESALSGGLRRRLLELQVTGGPISATAYWMYTEIKEHYGGDASASRRLRISSKALAEFSKLAANDRDRKAGSTSTQLSPEERDWLKRAMHNLVRRIHEVEAGAPNLPVLDKSNLAS